MVWVHFDLLAVLGLVTGIPKPGRWTANPFAALPSTTTLGISGLALGIVVLTANGVRAMGISFPNQWSILTRIFIVFYTDMILPLLLFEASKYAMEKRHTIETLLSIPV